MYTLLRTLSFRSILLEQVPSITISLIIAELFYKFHSFTLECVAFIATWCVIDGLRQIVVDKLFSTHSQQSSK